ncbi:MAG: TonB-dependent receptor plug domain-containing protein [Colwellia sp.]|nr:TonB-dependent receptor plug domain-containing protein [Colwellia sp.]
MKSFKVNNLTAAMLLTFPIMSTSLYAAETTENNAQEDQIEVIEVTGIKGSLRRAEAVKLSAKNIVEAITAEDLGAFSDDSIAEALQRLPGVQVQEDTVGSRGDQISIRGLGSQFVVATVNGRSAWGSGSGEGKDLRSFNFNVVPSEVVHQVVVTKTPLANTVESGIGGSVDMQTLRPLDDAKFKDKNWLGFFEARAEQTKIGDEDIGQRLSGAYVAQNDAETLGGYVAFNYSDIDSGKDRQQVRYRDSRTFFIDHNNNFEADEDEEYEDEYYDEADDDEDEE